MTEEAKKHTDALKTLAAFLDKVERQLPRDSAVPQTRDDAEKQLRSVKNVLEDMYDKQPQLDGLKTQVFSCSLVFGRICGLNFLFFCKNLGYRTSSSQERCSWCGCSTGSVGYRLWPLEGSARSLQSSLEIPWGCQGFPWYARSIISLAHSQRQNDVRSRADFFRPAFGSPPAAASPSLAGRV